MPTESPITSLIGQGHRSSFRASYAQSLSSEFAICKEFGEMPNLGAAQVSRSSETAKSAGSRVPTQQTQVDESWSLPGLPTGARVLSPLKVAVCGRGSVLRTRQLWEGTVTEIRDGGFVARLADLTNARNPDEQAVFETAEVSQDDRHLVRPGSAFYLVIGTEQTPGGTRKNVSIIQFRRLPAWTVSAAKKAVDYAVHARQFFRSED
jgi:hypothetical protein